MNGIWQRKICHADNEKLKKRNNRRNRTGKSRKNQNAKKKRKLQVFENSISGHNQISRDERKNKKRVPQMNEKNS